MYNISTTVIAKEILRDQKIVFEWDNTTKTVEIHFKELDDDSTFVTITESGFAQKGDELIAAIKDSTGGFTTVLDGLKAFMEHRINLNLIADKFPKEVSVHRENWEFAIGIPKQPGESLAWNLCVHRPQSAFKKLSLHEWKISTSLLSIAVPW